MSTEVENVRAMIREVAGEVRAEMTKDAERFIETLEKRFGSAEGARKAGVSTDFLAREGVTPAAKSPAEHKFKVGRALRMLAATRGNVEAAQNAAKARGDVEMAGLFEKAIEARQKAMALSDFTSGGALVPEEFSNEVIGLLYPALTVTSLGADTVPMPNGQLTIPYLDSGVTAYYVGELQNITTSEQTVGQIQLTAKKLAAIVPISNDLLRTPSARADQFVQNDLIRRMKVRTDQAFYDGTGASGQPLGLKNQVVAANSFAQSGTALANKVADLGKCQLKLQEQNVPVEGGGYILAPRTEWGLKLTLDSLGNFVFLKQMEAGMLMGHPFRSSTSVSTVLGGGAESEILFGAFKHVVIGDTESIEISVHADGAYHDGASVVSGISTDQTPMRAIAKHDLACRYRGKELALVTGVTWA